ncbi:hypothetical protein R1flu_003313 [Riccia fluitans]|uniref:Retrotransposon gag domain-containing protein n=1 Tax=Riccia fluitans TaxID=41844 RepID=A0ABD1Y8N2_9MARC
MFKGKEGDDPNLFLQEFDLTTDANHESEDADKSRLFPALLKKRASKWFLNNLRQEKEESLRQYTQRFKDLICRADTNDLAVLIEWYVGGLPLRIAHYCRWGPQGSIHEVIARVEKYETARQTDRLRKEKDKKKKKKHRRDDDSSFSSSSEESSSSSSNLEEEGRAHHRRKSEKDKKKKKKSSRSWDNSSDDSSSNELVGLKLSHKSSIYV